MGIVGNDHWSFLTKERNGRCPPALVAKRIGFPTKERARNQYQSLQHFTPPPALLLAMGLLACRRLGIEGVGVVNTIMNEKKVPSPTQRMTRTSVGNPIRFASRAGVHRAFRKITLVKVERNGTSRIPYCFFFSLFPACPVRVSCPPCKGSLTNERKTH